MAPTTKIHSVWSYLHEFLNYPDVTVTHFTLTSKYQLVFVTNSDCRNAAKGVFGPPYITILLVAASAQYMYSEIRSTEIFTDNLFVTAFLK